MRQQKGVALRPSALRVAVHLVAQQHLDRSACETGRAVRPDDGYMASRKILFQDGVSAVSAFRVYQAGEYRRVPYHGREEVLAERLAHFKRRLHHQHRGRVVVHIVAQHIHQHGRLSDLGRAHNHYFADMRIPDSVHDFPLIGRVLCVPAPRRCAVLCRQHPVGIGPLG